MSEFSSLLEMIRNSECAARILPTHIFPLYSDNFYRNESRSFHITSHYMHWCVYVCVLNRHLMCSNFEGLFHGYWLVHFTCKLLGNLLLCTYVRLETMCTSVQYNVPFTGSSSSLLAFICITLCTTHSVDPVQSFHPFITLNINLYTNMILHAWGWLHIILRKPSRIHLETIIGNLNVFKQLCIRYLAKFVKPFLSTTFVSTSTNSKISSFNPFRLICYSKHETRLRFCSM